MGLPIHTKTNAAGNKYKQYSHDLANCREYDEMSASSNWTARAIMLNKLINFVHYSWFHKKGTFSVHSFNWDYLSIPERQGS